MIVVTGAAGFIGSHVVDRLLSDGREVLGIDNFDPLYPRTRKEANLRSARVRRGFHFAECDIRDSGAVNAALEKAARPIETIVHLAARAGVRESIRDPEGFRETNALGTIHLLNAARRLRVRQFVFSSSSSIYGVNSNLPWREDDVDLKPISPYATSKREAEEAGRAFAESTGGRFIALRLFNAYGPRQRPDLAIARFAALIRAGKPVPFFGDGSTRRDYTFVGDTADAIVRAVGYTATPFEIINIGDHTAVSLRDMVATLGRVLERTPVVEHLPEQPGDVPHTWAEITKARELLGWRPATALEEGLRRYRTWLEAEDPAGTAA